MKPGMSLIKHYLQFKDFRAEEYAYLFERAAIIKKRFKNYEKYHAAGRPHAGDDLREGLDAHARELRGRHVPDGRLGRAPDHRRQPARPRRADRGQRAVISRMVDIVMIRTFEQTKIEALRRALARAGDQRPDQRVPPVPDPGRHLHLHRAPRLDRRARSWPGSATATTWPTPGCRPPTSSASRCTSARRAATRSTRRWPASAARLLQGLQGPARRLPRRRPGHHRRLDQHGLRGRERGAHEGLRRLVRRRAR